MPKLQRVQDLVGANAKRVRLESGRTLNDVAVIAKSYGLPWSNSRVSAFERGAVPATIDVLAQVAATLSEACARQVTLADLVYAEDPRAVVVNGETMLGTDSLLAFVTGSALPDGAMKLPSAEVMEFVQRKGGRGDMDMGDAEIDHVAELLRRSGLPEERAAKDLGITEAQLAADSYTLWRRTLSEERDHRAPDGASPQRRGAIAVELKRELKALRSGDD